MRKQFNSDNIWKIFFSIIIGVFTVVMTVDIANQQTQGANNEIIENHTKQIDELKSCADKKVDKQLYDYSLQQLDKRLTNIEKSQEEIKIILITNK